MNNFIMTQGILVENFKLISFIYMYFLQKPFDLQNFREVQFKHHQATLVTMTALKFSRVMFLTFSIVSFPFPFISFYSLLFTFFYSFTTFYPSLHQCSIEEGTVCFSGLTPNTNSRVL